MRIKKVTIWDDSQNRGYQHAVIEVEADNIPDNYNGWLFAIERPGFAESHMANDPLGDMDNPWSGSESENTRLEPEGYIERDGNCILIRIGKQIVRHMQRGNYTFRLIDAGGHEISRKVIVWDVKVPVKPFRFESSATVQPQVTKQKEDSKLIVLRTDLEQSALDGDEVKFERLFSEISELSPEDPEAIQIREDFFVRQEENRLKELMIEAEEAYDRNDLDTITTILDQIDSIRPGYPPAERLKKKMKPDTPPVQEPTPIPEDDPRPKKPKGIVVTICILVVLLLAGCGYFFYKKGETSGTKSTPAQTEDAQVSKSPETILSQCRDGSLDVGQCYAEGLSILKKVEKNPDPNRVAMAEHIFETAANNGHAEASRQLGVLYDPAKSLTPDRRTQRPAKPSLAYDYYKKAIDTGSEQACKDLKALHSWLKKNAGSDQTMALLLKVKKWNLSECGR